MAIDTHLVEKCCKEIYSKLFGVENNYQVVFRVQKSRAHKYF